ncbi:hypothetical protein GGU11DRAFT_160352 [Lentinula aff. detonsa]|nr:hypothetical protein GGU11DRAFT_160352 [Lentinula aff. detonsa]
MILLTQLKPTPPYVDYILLSLFLLGRTIYVKFLHDNQFVTIFSARGLSLSLSGQAPFPFLMPTGTWVIGTSQLTHFAGRMVVVTYREDLNASGQNLVTDKLALASLSGFVRILMNDAVRSLEFFCSGKKGLCTLENFVKNQG